MCSGFPGIYCLSLSLSLVSLPTLFPLKRFLFLCFSWTASQSMAQGRFFIFVICPDFVPCSCMQAREKRATKQRKLKKFCSSLSLPYNIISTSQTLIYGSTPPPKIPVSHMHTHTHQWCYITILDALTERARSLIFLSLSLSFPFQRIKMLPSYHLFPRFAYCLSCLCLCYLCMYMLHVSWEKRLWLCMGELLMHGQASLLLQMSFKTLRPSLTHTFMENKRTHTLMRTQTWGKRITTAGGQH